jgi:hypothetical protein
MFSDLIDAPLFSGIGRLLQASGLERASRAIGAAYGDEPEAIMAALVVLCHGLALLHAGTAKTPGSLRRGRSRPGIRKRYPRRHGGGAGLRRGTQFPIAKADAARQQCSRRCPARPDQPENQPAETPHYHGHRERLRERFRRRAGRAERL